MKNNTKIILCLSIVLLINCKKSTNPENIESALSKYENQYKILFQGGKNLYTIHSDGTNLFQLTNTSTHKQDAVWSPDGSKIAFVSGDLGTNFYIYIMDSDGTNVIKLSQQQGYNFYPRFTPDGTKVIFNSNLQLYSVNIDGTNHIILQTAQISSSTSYCIHPFRINSYIKALAIMIAFMCMNLIFPLL